jgi:hypothetical protein
MDPLTWFVVALAMTAISVAISYALRPKSVTPEPAELAEFQFPQAEEGTPQAVVFGDVWQDGYQHLWHGNLQTNAIKK